MSLTGALPSAQVGAEPSEQTLTPGESWRVDILFFVGDNNNVKTYQGHNRKAKQQPELAPEV